MFNKLSIAAVVLTSLAFTSASHADEVSLESLVGNMVSSALAVTQQDMSFDVQKSILTTNHTINLEEEESISTVVTFTKIDATEVAKVSAE